MFEGNTTSNQQYTSVYHICIKPTWIFSLEIEYINAKHNRPQARCLQSISSSINDWMRMHVMMLPVHTNDQNICKPTQTKHKQT
jgi:hypothetical protein